MSRTLVAAGSIRAGRATISTMRAQEPIIVEGDATSIAVRLGGARAVRDLDEVRFAEYVERLAALGGAVEVHPDGSFTRVR